MPEMCSFCLPFTNLYLEGSLHHIAFAPAQEVTIVRSSFMFCRGNHETEDRYYVQELQDFGTDLLCCLKAFTAMQTPVLHQYLSNMSALILLHLCKSPKRRWSFRCFGLCRCDLRWCVVTKRNSKPQYGLVCTQVLFCFGGGNLRQKNGTGWTGGGSNILKYCSQICENLLV